MTPPDPGWGTFIVMLLLALVIKIDIWRSNR